MRSETLLADVVEDEGEVLSLLTVVLDGDGRGALNLASVALLVVVAVTEPLTEVHPRVNLDERDAGRLSHGLRANRNGVSKHANFGFTYGHELVVLHVLAVRGEHADESLLAVESLENLIKALDESYT